MTNIKAWSLIAALALSPACPAGAAIALDGHNATGGFTAGNTSLSVSLTTTSTNDLACVSGYSNAAGGTSLHFTAVSGGSLSWTQAILYQQDIRGFGGTTAHAAIEVWCAPAATTLTATSISVTWNAAADSANLVAWGISGTTQTFDTNGALPAENFSTSSTASQPTATYSTSNVNDMVIAWAGEAAARPSGSACTSLSNCIPPPSGFTGIDAGFSSGNVHFSAQGVAYKIVSATQSSVSQATTADTYAGWAAVISAAVQGTPGAGGAGGAGSLLLLGTGK